MDEEERGNKLAWEPSQRLEYAVHGLFKRSPSDTNGIHGCWWVGVPMLLEAMGEDLDELLEQYEHDAAEARAEALAEARFADDGGGEEEEEEAAGSGN